MLNSTRIADLIKQSIPEARVNVREFSTGGDHFEVEVLSPAFSGKRLVEQHQMVYAALRSHLDDGAIHALALRTSATN